MKKYFIGIDFSKEKFDASIVMSGNLTDYSHREFENSQTGCKALVEWIAAETRARREEWLVCGEHTGLYSLELSEYLVSHGIFMWLEDPSQIHCCHGLRREKTDKSDSYEIAKYAFRYQDKARMYKPLSVRQRRLKVLLAYRSSLVAQRAALVQSASEVRKIIARDTATRLVADTTKSLVARFSAAIKKVEKMMVDIINGEEETRRNFQLACSVKGIGLINAVSFLILTENFTRITDPRKFATYAGMAPFERSSGTNVHKGVHTSHRAHAGMKDLLTEAARSAINFNPEIKAYYRRKIAEGKPSRVVVNNVRNKLIQRVFAVVREGVPYSVNHHWAS